MPETTPTRRPRKTPEQIRQQAFCSALEARLLLGVSWHTFRLLRADPTKFFPLAVRVAGRRRPLYRTADLLGWASQIQPAATS
jgi:hypothetical protein